MNFTNCTNGEQRWRRCSRGGGGDLPRPLRRRGVYLKDYEFLECHEWWTEMETVQAKGWRGLIIRQGGGDYI